MATELAGNGDNNGLFRVKQPEQKSADYTTPPIREHQNQLSSAPPQTPPTPPTNN